MSVTFITKQNDALQNVVIAISLAAINVVS